MSRLKVKLQCTDVGANLDVYKGTAVLGVDGECDVEVRSIQQGDSRDDIIRITVQRAVRMPDGFKCVIQVAQSQLEHLVEEHKRKNEGALS